jgi:Domain of unknown function (DUF5979)
VRANRVLTRPRGWALLVAVALAAGVPLTGGTLGGAAPAPPSFTLTIKKVVTGVVPPGTTFTVSIGCVGVMGASGSASTTPTTGTVHTDPLTPIVVFDAQGNPTTANTIPVTVGSTCTATETVTGGAQSVSYGCATTNATEVACVSSQQVRVPPGMTIEGGAATITVTNAFPTPPPPPVVVAPQFTG